MVTGPCWLKFFLVFLVEDFGALELSTEDEDASEDETEPNTSGHKRKVNKPEHFDHYSEIFINLKFINLSSKSECSSSLSYL